MRSLLVFLLLAVALPALAEQFTGRVVGVADGDTLSVMRAGKAEKVRLHGIDAPESHQAFGSRAKQVASQAVFGKDVTVRVQDRDRYGRVVGEVIMPDGRSLNHELVRAGMAWWYRQYAKNDTKLAALENEAKSARRGLWADPAPVAPWEFRKSGRAQGAGESRRMNVGSPSGYTAGSPPSATGAGTVYVTPTGKKYHTASCRHAKTGTAVGMAQAQARGLEPCGVCRP